MIFSVIVNRSGGYFALRERFFRTNSGVLKRLILFINKGYEHETNAYLPFNNTIDGPVNFLHGTYGVFISGGARIGKNCTIYQQVTIGSNMLIDSKGLGSPTIGDNCLIGAGAKIIGNVKIGDNCRIGANAVVTRDLPDNSLCVLGKPIVVAKENLENNIYQKREEGWGYIKNGEFVLETKESHIARLEKSL